MESPTKLKTDAIQLSTPDYDWERVGFWVDEARLCSSMAAGYLSPSPRRQPAPAIPWECLEASEDADLLDRNSWRKSRYPGY